MSNHTDMSTTVVDASEPSLHDMIDEESSVELEFHQDDSNFDDTTPSSSTLNQSSQSTPAPSISTPSGGIGGGTADEASNVTPSVLSYEHHSDSGGSGTSYEIVDEGNNNDDDDDDYLDDLEAEIARELGEL